MAKETIDYNMVSIRIYLEDTNTEEEHVRDHKWISLDEARAIRGFIGRITFGDFKPQDREDVAAGLRNMYVLLSSFLDMVDVHEDAVADARDHISLLKPQAD